MALNKTARQRGLRRYALRFLFGTLVAALVLLHAGLLWQRLIDQSLFEPAVGLRWALSVAVLLVGYRFRRAGLSLLSGRPAIGLWVVILLLHAGGIPAPGAAPVLGEATGLTLASLAGVALALASWLAAASEGARWALGGAGRLAIAPAGSLPGRVLSSSQLSRPPPV